MIIRRKQNSTLGSLFASLGVLQDHVAGREERFQQARLSSSTVIPSACRARVLRPASRWTDLSPTVDSTWGRRGEAHWRHLVVSALALTALSGAGAEGCRALRSSARMTTHLFSPFSLMPLLHHRLSPLSSFSSFFFLFFLLFCPLFKHLLFPPFSQQDRVFDPDSLDPWHPTRCNRNSAASSLLACSRSRSSAHCLVSSHSALRGGLKICGQDRCVRIMCLLG